MTSDSPIAIDPARLLRVRFVLNVVEHEIVAVTCTYVAATADDGTSCVAVEILADMTVQTPSAPYYSFPVLFTRYVIPPANLRSIWPYQ